MKTITVGQVINAVKEMCIEANYLLGPEEIAALDDALKKEESPTGREVLKQIRLNADIAKNEDIPICQDTGLSVFFVEIGNDVFIEGGSVRATKKVFSENRSSTLSPESIPATIRLSSSITIT